MHAIQYRLKRSYWSALKTLNALLEEFSLTGARFDLLTLARRPYGQLQSVLWKQLGVSRSVVCRILQKLEKLGWVRRWKPDEDRRQRMVQLTKLGREVFERARDDHPLNQKVELAWDSAVDPTCFFLREWREEVFSRLQGWLDSIRHSFRDRAYVPYEWSDEEDMDPDMELDADEVAEADEDAEGAEEAEATEDVEGAQGTEGARD
jgi:DNA-binding MarR family transcriptional regulator